MRNQFTQAIGELRGKLIDTSRRNKLIIEDLLKVRI